MGRGTWPSALMLALVASGALAAGAPALPADLGSDLLPSYSSASPPSAASPRLPGAAAAEGALPAGPAYDVVGKVAAALGALAGSVGAAAGAFVGGLAGFGGALLGGLAALLAAAAGAAAGLVAALGGLANGVATKVAAHPERLLTPLAGTGAAWGLSALHARVPSPRALLAPLFSRLERHELLRHEGRQKMYEYVRDRPGAHLSQVHGHMGLGWGATVYHLRRLREAQLLTARKVGNQLCHFVNGDTHTAQEQQLLAATKTAKAQAIVDYLKLRGPSTQRDLATELGMSSALVSWHAKRLEDLGVVARMRTGRTCLLALPSAQARPAPAPAPAQEAPAARAPQVRPAPQATPPPRATPALTA